MDKSEPFVVAFVAKAIKDTPIVQQSLVWAMSASSIPIGIAMSMALDGREGAALDGTIFCWLERWSEMVPSPNLSKSSEYKYWKYTFKYLPIL